MDSFSCGSYNCKDIDISFKIKKQSTDILISLNERNQGLFIDVWNVASFGGAFENKMQLLLSNNTIIWIHGNGGGGVIYTDYKTILAALKTEKWSTLILIRNERRKNVL